MVMTVLGQFIVALVLVQTSGHSMNPTYDDGQFLFRTDAHEPGYTFYDVQKGDVIVFESTLDNDTTIVITHRVVKVHDYEDGSRYLVTKGDNPETNAKSIEGVETHITEDMFRGIVVGESNLTPAPLGDVVL